MCSKVYPINHNNTNAYEKFCPPKNTTPQIYSYKIESDFTKKEFKDRL